MGQVHRLEPSSSRLSGLPGQAERPGPRLRRGLREGPHRRHRPPLRRRRQLVGALGPAHRAIPQRHRGCTSTSAKASPSSSPWWARERTSRSDLGQPPLSDSEIYLARRRAPSSAARARHHPRAGRQRGGQPRRQPVQERSSPSACRSTCCPSRPGAKACSGRASRPAPTSPTSSTSATRCGWAPTWRGENTHSGKLGTDLPTLERWGLRRRRPRPGRRPGGRQY